MSSKCTMSCSSWAPSTQVRLQLPLPPRAKKKSAALFFSGKLMDSEDDFLFQQMQQNYPAAVTCAEKIRTFVLRKYGVFLPNEETAYLALHVARLTSGK